MERLEEELSHVSEERIKVIGGYKPLILRGNPIVTDQILGMAVRTRITEEKVFRDQDFFNKFLFTTLLTFSHLPYTLEGFAGGTAPTA